MACDRRCGWLACRPDYERRRLWPSGDIVIGIIGAFIAGWLFPYLNINLGGGIVGEIIAAAIGAIILLLVLRLVRSAA